MWWAYCNQNESEFPLLQWEDAHDKKKTNKKKHPRPPPSSVPKPPSLTLWHCTVSQRRSLAAHRGARSSGRTCTVRAAWAGNRPPPVLSHTHTSATSATSSQMERGAVWRSLCGVTCLALFGVRCGATDHLWDSSRRLDVFAFSAFHQWLFKKPWKLRAACARCNIYIYIHMFNCVDCSTMSQSICVENLKACCILRVANVRARQNRWTRAQQHTGWVWMWVTSLACFCCFYEAGRNLPNKLGAITWNTFTQPTQVFIKNSFYYYFSFFIHARNFFSFIATPRQLPTRASWSQFIFS